MASIDSKLNSVSESIVCIPYDGSDEDLERMQDPQVGWNASGEIFTPPFLKERDLRDGPLLRLNVYERAWEKCKTRLQDSIRELHSPTIKHTLDAVREAYTQDEPLLGYTELPTIIISGADRSATSAVVSDVERLLSSSTDKRDDAMSEDGDKQNTIFVSSITSGDCANLPSAIKALIGGFVKHDPEGGGGEAQSAKASQRYPSSSVLAPFDMNVLEAWYQAVKQFRGNEGHTKLVVLLHDFENIDPAVMQDVFYICSLYIPRLPLVFILSCASPPQTSFLHAVYPRTTLTLLGLTKINVKNGVEVLEHVLLKTFFDVNSEPTVLPSPATLDFVIQQFTRTAMSLDLFVMILKLVYIRHFTEPLTVFAIDELLGEPDLDKAAGKLEQSSSRPFLNSLLARLHHPEKSRTILSPSTNNTMEVDEEPVDGHSSNKSPSKRSLKAKGKQHADAPEPLAKWRAASASEVLWLVHETRVAHLKRTAGVRVAFRVFLLVRDFVIKNGFKHLLDAGYRGVASGGRKPERTICEMMVSCLRGTFAARDGSALAGAIRKLPSAHLSSLLSELYTFIHALPSEVRNGESDTMVKLAEWSARIDASPDEVRDIAKEVEEWSIEYSSGRMRDYTETNMWDVWYTKGPQGISELFNPSPRSSIITALVHPDRYLELNENSPTETTHSILESPDTSILFQRYLESGRMINVYDWFESFASALESRRNQKRKQAREQEREEEKGQQARKKQSGSAQQGTPGTPSRSRGARQTQNGRTSTRHISSSPLKRSAGRNGGKGEATATGKGKRKMGVGASSPDSDSSSDGDGDKSENSDEEEEGEDAKETWKAEVQARFLRAVQELDFMGFIRHTGRKADHVHKTVYDLPEYVE